MLTKMYTILISLLLIGTIAQPALEFSRARRRLQGQGKQKIIPKTDEEAYETDTWHNIKGKMRMGAQFVGPFAIMGLGGADKPLPIGMMLKAPLQMGLTQAGVDMQDYSHLGPAGLTVQQDMKYLKGMFPMANTGAPVGEAWDVIALKDPGYAAGMIMEGVKENMNKLPGLGDHLENFATVREELVRMQTTIETGEAKSLFHIVPDMVHKNIFRWLGSTQEFQGSEEMQMLMQSNRPMSPYRNPADPLPEIIAGSDNDMSWYIWKKTARMLEPLSLDIKEKILLESQRQMDGVSAGKLMRACLEEDYMSSLDAEAIISKVFENLQRNTRSAADATRELMGKWDPSQGTFEDHIDNLEELYFQGVGKEPNHPQFTDVENWMKLARAQGEAAQSTKMIQGLTNNGDESVIERILEVPNLRRNVADLWPEGTEEQAEQILSFVGSKGRNFDVLLESNPQEEFLANAMDVSNRGWEEARVDEFNLLLENEDNVIDIERFIKGEEVDMDTILADNAEIANLETADLEPLREQFLTLESQWNAMQDDAVYERFQDYLRGDLQIEDMVPADGDNLDALREVLENLKTSVEQLNPENLRSQENPLGDFIVANGLLHEVVDTAQSFYSEALKSTVEIGFEDGISETYSYTPSNSLGLLLPDIFLASGIILTLMMCFFCAYDTKIGRSYQ